MRIFINTTAGCPWCKGSAGWPQQLGGDCSCNQRLPTPAFTQGLGLCASNRWTYPKPSIAVLPSFTLSTILDATFDQIFMRTTNLIVGGIGELRFTVSVQPDGNGGNVASGGSMNVTGCVTLAGTLTVNFDGASVYTVSSTPLVYTLLSYSCKNGNSLFNTINFVGLPTLGSAAARVVQGLTSVDLIIEQAIVVPPPPGIPPATLQSPVTVSFQNFTPSLQISSPSGFTAFAFFRSLVECRLPPVGSNITGVIQNLATKIDFPTTKGSYSILQYEETVNSVAVGHITFITTLPNSAEVTLDFVSAITPEAFAVTLGTLTVPVDVYNIKYSLTVSNWTFTGSAASNTRLCLLTDIQNSTFQPFQTYEFVAGPIPESSKLRLLTSTAAASPVLELLLVNVSVADGSNNVPVSYGMDIFGSQLWVALPYFSTKVEYDPNLGVVVAGEGDGGDGGGGDSLAWIAAVVIVPLFIIAVFIAIVGGVAYFIYRHKKHEQIHEASTKRSTMIFFGPSEPKAVVLDATENI